MAKVYGYARVSTARQNLDRQIEKLLQFGISEENIICDKFSGRNFDERVGYNALKSVLGLREGDTLVVTNMDRFGRNKAQIKDELEYWNKHNIKVKILDIPTTLIELDNEQNTKWIENMLNNILIEVLSSFAEQERNKILESQAEGIKAARSKGKHLGRPVVPYPDEWENYYTKWQNNEITAVEMMKRLQLTKSTFYKLAKNYEK
jgi:DNA invertase Pin-like site-specific DNA recombinase